MSEEDYSNHGEREQGFPGIGPLWDGWPWNCISAGGCVTELIDV